MSDVDTLVPDPKVAEEFHTTLMTLWRWDHDPAKAALGWPPKVKIDKSLTVHQGVIEFPVPPARNLAMENETNLALGHRRSPKSRPGGFSPEIHLLWLAGPT